MVEAIRWDLEGALYHRPESDVPPHEVLQEWSSIAAAASRGHLMCAFYLVETEARIDFAGSRHIVILKQDKGIIAGKIDKKSNEDNMAAVGTGAHRYETPQHLALNTRHNDNVRLSVLERSSIDQLYDTRPYTPLERATEQNRVSLVKTMARKPVD
jgi:hypothetical protein